MWPLALGAGAIALVLLASSKKAEASTDLPVRGKGAPLTRMEAIKIASVTPSRTKPGAGKQEVVTFTRRSVFWRINPKTKKQEMRVEVIESPEELARAASTMLGRNVPLEVFTLATVMASEAGTGPDLAKVAIGHAARTAAAKGKRTLTAQILGKYPLYGSQHGRYAASKSPPAVRDIELAEAITAGKIANPTPGAVQWDSPRGQRQLVARGVPGYDKENTPEAIAQKRRADGRVAVYLPGVDPGYLRLWRAA